MEVGGAQRRYIILQVSASNPSQYVSLAHIKLMYMYMQNPYLIYESIISHGGEFHPCETDSHVRWGIHVSDILYIYIYIYIFFFLFSQEKIRLVDMTSYDSYPLVGGTTYQKGIYGFQTQKRKSLFQRIDIIPTIPLSLSYVV